jgi:hypothetical protein
VCSLAHHADKLKHLHHRKARLPPNGQALSGFRDFRVHADKIIRVHHGVNEPIQQNSQINVTIVVYVAVEPVKQKDGCVMVHVKKTELLPLLPNDNKDSVPEIPDLADVKEP